MKYALLIVLFALQGYCLYLFVTVMLCMASGFKRGCFGCRIEDYFRKLFHL